MNQVSKVRSRRKIKTPLGFVLTLLNNFSASSLVEQLGLRGPAKRLLYQGMRASVKVGSIAQSKFQPLKELLPDQRLSKGIPKNLFDLTLTEEQEMVRDMILSFARQNLRPIARKVDETGEVPKEFLTQCQEAGIVLTGIPASIGGAGTDRSPLSSTLLCEDLATGDMALALVALAPLGFVNALTEFGSHSQQSQYLPAFTGERSVSASLALMEPGVRFNPHHLKTTAKRTDEGYRLDGVKCMVPLGEQAEAFMVFADLEKKGPCGFIVEAHSEGLVARSEKYMGLKAAGLSRLELNGVQVSAKARLGEDEVEYHHQRMVDLCRIGVCALSVGTAQSVLDYVIQYCNDRVAFSEPISHRQAVAFMIADIAIELEGMRLMTYRAASRAEQGLDFHREAYLAQVLCAEKSMEIGSKGVQLLGGHGYVCEHPVELWYRQLRATGILEGSVLI